MNGRAGHRSQSTLFELRPYFRQIAGLLVVGSIAGVLMNVAIVLPAIFLGRAINTVLAYKRGDIGSGAVTTAALLFFLATVATEAPRVGKRWWLGVARTRFQANVRADALRGVLTWPMERLTSMSVGEIMARVIGDVEVLGQGMGEIVTETWDTLLFSASLIVTMIIYDSALAALALAPVPVALYLAKVAGRRVALRTTAARQAEADLTGVIHEQLGGSRLLRLTGRGGIATERVERLAGRQAKAQLSAIRLDEALGAVYSALLSSGVVFIIWLGGRGVARGTLSLGAFMAFLQLFVRFVTRAPRIAQMVNRVQAAGAAYVRLRPLLAPPPPFDEEPQWSSWRSTHVAGAGGTTTPPPRPSHSPVTLSFTDVSFEYPGASRSTLDHVSFEVDAGAFVAVTGAVGSGKSALARIAAGIYAPNAGRVLVDNSVASAIKAEDRTSLIGFLGPDLRLFSGSVAENVLLSAEPLVDVTPDYVIEAVRIAALGRDIDLMPDGLNTEIGELGVRVSGGQRQRIALARALAAGGQVPGLIVLDDPFTAVDLHTEATIIRSLNDTLGRGAPIADRSTVLLCSHRLAAFPLADLIIVLDQGRIAEQGTHASLLAAQGLYARMFHAQVTLSSIERRPAGLDP